MELLKRKMDDVFREWKKDPDRLPLIVKGARQVGKTETIRKFGRECYGNFIEINFVLQQQFRHIFDAGLEASAVIRSISLIRPDWTFTPGDTLIFFDEIQHCINAASSLKSFKIDGRYDVICSGSLMGINYNEIESNSVGYKEDVKMYSMDFEEFLWAKGYSPGQIEDMYQHMLTVTPFSSLEMEVMLEQFREYMVIGGMPAIVNTFVRNGNYSGTLRMQRQILLDYEEDITKYAGGLDKGRILNVYRKIPVFLGMNNRKFQITKVARGARSREYVGTVEWLLDAGIVNACYCMEQPELPLKGNYDPNNFKLYFGDAGLLIASLDDEAQEDLRVNRNFNTYKGAVYESIMAQILVQQGYSLYFYRNEKSTVEIDFLVRDRSSLVPIEVKATDGATISLNRLIDRDRYPDIHYGIKFGLKNIGYNGKFYTFPYFLGFLLRRFLKEAETITS